MLLLSRSAAGYGYLADCTLIFQFGVTHIVYLFCVTHTLSLHYYRSAKETLKGN